MTSKKPDGGFVVLLAFCLVFGTWAVTELPEPLPECSDGIDNDVDGGFDNDPVNGDPDCEYPELSNGVLTIHPCPLWESETNPPLTLQQCVNGA